MINRLKADSLSQFILGVTGESVQFAGATPLSLAARLNPTVRFCNFRIYFRKPRNSSISFKKGV